MDINVLSAWHVGRLPKWQAAMSQLLDAAFYAHDLGRSTWEFAVAIECLRNVGLNDNDLRWLISKGLIDQNIKVKKRHGLRRSSIRESAKQFSLPTRTSFVLTDSGLRFALRTCGSPSAERDSPITSAGADLAVSNTVPRWDRETRTLWFGAHRIKRFKVPAATQEIVLAAFAEENWPPCILDPLPPIARVNQKRRLHDTINRLNRSHAQRQIRFHGNGNGRAIYWERVKPTPIDT